MKYHGKLFGKLWDKYIDIGKTTDDFDKLESKQAFIARPFEDLIKEIEIDGERFVPIVKIGELAFGFSEIDKRFSPNFWINDQEPNGTMEFYQSFGNKTYTLKVTIWEDGNVRISIGNNLHIPSNQVQIVKNLIKWGFIEP